MIDWTAFVDSLDELSFDSICEVIQARKVDEAETLAQTLVLSFSEVKLAREDPRAAIITVHHRLRCGFLVAKTAVDLVLEADDEEAASREDGGDGPAYEEAPDDYQETLIGVEMPFID
jgi:hypothetical protein